MDSPYSKYAVASISTENNVQKLMFIFDQVIKLLHQTKRCIEDNDIEGKYKKLTKLYNVFFNLSGNIDTESDVNSQDSVKVLENFYLLTAYKLQDINIYKEKENEIDAIIESITLLRNTLIENSQ